MSRASLAVLAASVMVLGACDDKQAASSGEAAAPTATASATASVKPKPKVEMPPRPIPKPRTTVGSGDTAETQLKAIAYMHAMGQPHDG